MRITATPTYKDLFNEELANPISLISQYSYHDTLKYLGYINAQLYLNQENDPNFQEVLLKKIIKYWPEKLGIAFENLVRTDAKRRNQSPNLFKSLYVTNTIHQILINNIQFSGEKEFNAIAEMNLIKYYFYCVGITSNEMTNSIKFGIPLNEEFQFQKTHWPFLFKQFDFNDKIDPILQTIKLFLLLRYFEEKDKYRKYVKQYLNEYKRAGIWNFALDLLELVKISFQKIQNFDAHHFLIKNVPEFTSILDTLSIDVSEYNSTEENLKDFSGIRKRPLLKLNSEFYLVLNWKFIYNSIYTGFLFDFNEKSGIKEALKDFGTYKSVVGKEIMETSFKNILQYAMGNQNCIIHFDSNDIANCPDCYLRIGKYLFLFEFKDYLIPTNVIASGDFETIKKHIDNKFIQNENEKSKGINQLIKNIEFISNETFSFDPVIGQSIKRRNLVIFPIIITTNFLFQAPGVNSYLAKIMHDKMEKSQSNKIFSKIYPLTMIDFTFLYEHIQYLRNKEIDLRDLISAYHAKIAKHEKNFKRKPSYELDHDRNSSFEENLPKNFKKQGLPQKREGFAKALFEAFNIPTEDGRIF